MHSDIKSKKFVFVFGKLINKLNIIPIANSEFTKNSFKPYCDVVLYPGFDKERTGVDYVGKSFREEYNIPKSTIVFGIAARIDNLKAQELVVEALMNRMFLEEDFVLLLAGIIQRKDVFDKIQSFAGEDFGEKIIYVGDLKSMPKFYASIDIVVNSRKNPEPFGISVVEAMASGLPIIASNKRGGR